MARLARVSPAHIPQHIIQRGNNRQACFIDERDFTAYLAYLREYAAKYAVELHAWVLMPNHVHLLGTPHHETSPSLMMQGLGRKYVRHFNHRHARTGTLWEGRYKSCLVQADEYLFEVQRYIELNPVRAQLVDDPADYPWSSYRANALGEASPLRTAHPLYASLGKNRTERLANYQELFDNPADMDLTTIRDMTHKGMALGNESFRKDIERSTGRRLTPRRPGRPPKTDR